MHESILLTHAHVLRETNEIIIEAIFDQLRFFLYFMDDTFFNLMIAQVLGLLLFDHLKVVLHVFSPLKCVVSSPHSLSFESVWKLSGLDLGLTKLDDPATLDFWRFSEINFFELHFLSSFHEIDLVDLLVLGVAVDSAPPCEMRHFENKLTRLVFDNLNTAVELL